MTLKNPLSALEHRVMHILWKKTAVSAADVQSALLPDRPLRDSTVRTVLSRLEEKGHVRHSLDGRTFIYSPVEKPQNLAARAVRQIIDRLCHGSVESLLVGMVDDDVLAPDDLARIAKRIAREREQEKRKKPGKDRR